MTCEAGRKPVRPAAKGESKGGRVGRAYGEGLTNGWTERLEANGGLRKRGLETVGGGAPGWREFRRER